MLISKHLLLHFFFASFQIRKREQNTLKAELTLEFLVDTPRVTIVGVDTVRFIYCSLPFHSLPPISILSGGDRQTGSGTIAR